MGAHVSRNDFEWVYTDQPHASRRIEILKKHPEIKELMGPEPKMKWIVSAMVLVQVITMWYLRNSSWPTILLMAYFFGGVINHSLTLAIHEIGHNLAFGQCSLNKNRLLGMIANLPFGVPMFASFKKYHRDHHRYLGVDNYDPDLPTKLEAFLFCRTWTKILWLCIYPLIYTIRPFIVCRVPINIYEIYNAVMQIVFDALIWYFMGWKMVFYMVFGTVITMGPHPIAGHLIAEHYMFEKGYETYSYYGPFNWITFNVGYHMEHHDFPYIPFTKLPEVKRIAPEYYDHLPQHYSWIKVFYDFITDPNMGPYARNKRQFIPKTSKSQGKKNFNNNHIRAKDCDSKCL